jgi:acetyl esterase/lipase
MLKGRLGPNCCSVAALLHILNKTRPSKAYGIDGDALEAFLRPWHEQHPLSSYEQGCTERLGHGYPRLHLDLRTPLASPLYANLRGIAPLLIQVGSAETLLDDAVRLANVAGAANVAVTLEVWPDMIHAWPLFHQQVAAGRHAIARAAAFIRSRMSGHPD